jgi:hypothetical protein
MALAFRLSPVFVSFIFFGPLLAIARTLLLDHNDTREKATKTAFGICTRLLMSQMASRQSGWQSLKTSATLLEAFSVDDMAAKWKRRHL